MSRLCTAILLLAIVTAGIPLHAEEDDSELQRRFRRGFAETGEKISKLSFRARCQQSSEPNSASKKFEVAVHEASTLTKGAPNSGGGIWLGNDRYDVNLTQLPSGEYAAIVPAKHFGTSRAKDKKSLQRRRNARSSALLSGYYTVAAFINEDEFKILSITPEQHDGKELLRISFNYVYKKYVRYSDAYFLIDPENEWMPVEYAATIHDTWRKSKQKHMVTFQYEDSVDGVPIATRVEYQSTPVNDPDMTYETVTTAGIIDRSVSRDEFYVAHYGLAEPRFEEVGGTPQ